MGDELGFIVGYSIPILSVGREVDDLHGGPNGGGLLREVVWEQGALWFWRSCVLMVV